MNFIKNISKLDKAVLLKICTVIVILWTCCLISFIFAMCVFYNRLFFSFGIYGNNYFITLPINNWTTYSLIMLYLFINTFITIISSQILLPFYSNDIQDILHENTMPFKRKEAYWVYILVGSQSTYTIISQFIQIYIVLTQIDFFLMGLLSFVVLQLFATYGYMYNNIYIDSIV